MVDLAKQSNNLEQVKEKIKDNITELSTELGELKKKEPVVTQEAINQAKSDLYTATETYQNAASYYATVSAAFQAQKMMSETPSAGAKKVSIASTGEEENVEETEETQQNPEEEKTVDAGKDVTSPDQQDDASTNSEMNTDNTATGVDKSGEDTSNTDSNSVSAVSTGETVTTTEGSTDGDSTTEMETSQSQKVSNDIDVTCESCDDNCAGSLYHLSAEGRTGKCT